MNPSDKAAIEALLGECQRVSLGLAKDKILPSSEAVKEVIASRKRLMIRVKEKKADLRRDNREGQDWIDVMNLAEERLKADLAELDDVKWQKIHDEREASKPHGVTSDRDSAAA